MPSPFLDFWVSFWVDLVVESFPYGKRGNLSRAFHSRKLLNTGQSPRMGLINTGKNDIG
jgi:hypothetical protein